MSEAVAKWEAFQKDVAKAMEANGVIGLIVAGITPDKIEDGRVTDLRFHGNAAMPPVASPNSLYALRDELMKMAAQVADKACENTLKAMETAAAKAAEDTSSGSAEESAET